MVEEHVRQNHRAHPQAPVEHAVVGQQLHDMGAEAADRTFLDGEENQLFLVLPTT